MAPNEPSKHGLSFVTAALPERVRGSIKEKLSVNVQFLLSVTTTSYSPATRSVRFWFDVCPAGTTPPFNADHWKVNNPVPPLGVILINPSLLPLQLMLIVLPDPESKDETVGDICRRFGSVILYD